MVLKRLFLSDTEEASAHPSSSPRRQNICSETELNESVKLYIKDGVEKAICR